MNSQSALRAEADSGDDSELSLSLFEKVQNEPVSFGLYEKCTSLTLPNYIQSKVIFDFAEAISC